MRRSDFTMCVHVLVLSCLAGAAQPEPILHLEPPPDAVARFGGIAVECDRERLDAMGHDGQIRLDLPVPGRAPVALHLERFEVFTPDAAVMVATVDADGGTVERAIPRPDLTLLRGSVVGQPDSRAFLAVGAHVVNGVVEHGPHTWVIAQDRTEGWTAVYDLDAVDPEQVHWADVACQVVHADEPVEQNTVRRRGSGGCPPKIRMAVETDWEFTSLFGGDTDASAEYAATVLGAVTTIYERDVEVGVSLCYLRLWASSNDPWTANNSQAQLSEFSTIWNSQMQHVERHLAHMFSGRGLGGGIAYVGVVCTSSGYAVSGNMSGSFPLPIEDHHGNNWDLMVVAHETGHNCGTGHTHDYNPPIDGCGNGDCELAWGGTIMSYCHLCSGGLSNMVMEIHPTVQVTIENYLAGVPCSLGGDGGPPDGIVDDVVVPAGTSVDIDVLANDWTHDCSMPSLVSHWPQSYHGGMIESIGDDPTSVVLRYTPPEASIETDIFLYVMEDGLGQQDACGVDIQIVQPRPADSPGYVEPGVDTWYYALEDPTDLPDFDPLDPIGHEVVGQIDFPSTNGDFAGSGLADNVGAVFEGYIEVPSTGTWTLHLESDDGSRLHLGSTMLIDNPGTHPMVERSGSMLLEGGLHEMRVEFFERGGGAGCILRMEGPGVAKQVVSSDLLWHATDMPGDANGDFVVDMNDILLLIAVWGPCQDPCAGDLNGDGVIGLDDLLEVLDNWTV